MTQALVSHLVRYVSNLKKPDTHYAKTAAAFIARQTAHAGLTALSNAAKILAFLPLLDIDRPFNKVDTTNLPQAIFKLGMKTSGRIFFSYSCTKLSALIDRIDQRF